MHCQSCGHVEIQSIIPLGKMPLANALLSSPPAHELRFNLEVMLCQHCGLAQLKDIVPPADLFSDYVYFSSNSDTMLQSAKDLVESIAPDLTQDALVIEIASNDGYLLKNYVNKGIRVLGIDPAQNIAKVANEQGIDTLCDFFSADLAQHLANDKQVADVIHANNVMAHVPDINGFIKGLKILLKPNGFCVIEVPYFADLVEKLEFDTIYHEHVYYFAVKPLKMAFERHGLALFNIEKIALHGGSLRLFVGHAGCHPINSVIHEMIKKEEESGLYNHLNYMAFMQKLSELKSELTSTLHKLKNENKKIAAYGASAKGTTLLNFFSIGKDILDFVVDRSTTKQGHFTPGTHLAILAPEELINQQIDYALLLVWNFADEVIAQQKHFIEKGGKFILPLPKVKVIS
jgi:SAM-dependent methyltransferase